jgi:hypothetical protein
MNIDNLKSAWNQFKATPTGEVSCEEVLSIISERKNIMFDFTPQRVMRNTALYSFLILICQGC